MARRRAAWATALLCAVCAWPCRAQQDGQVLQQEYFVRQNAGEALLVRINTFEAEFESTVLAPGGETLSVAELAGNSVAPSFHFIATTPQSRQLDLRVRSHFHTSRARFDLELNRLTVTDERSARLARGYQYLAWGFQPPGVDSAADWSVRVNTLLSAAGIFQDLGMEELRLWALYCVAWLEHRALGDADSALDHTGQILAGVRLMPFRSIELATLQLRGEALATLREAGSLPPTGAGPDPVQTELERAAQQAERMGFRLEQARSLYAAGRDFESRDLYGQAIERFEQALEITEALDIGEFSTRVREHIVAIHDRHGDVLASGAVLQEIESQLARTGAGDALAQNLLAQGRLFNQTYRYPQAIDVLNLALQHENSSMTRARVALELAQAHYQQGHFEEASKLARSAVTNPGTGEFRRPNDLLPLGGGLGIMADVARQRGEFGRMREARQAQLEHAGEDAPPAAILYAQGLDRLAEGGTARAAAAASFRACRQAASGANQAHWKHLATLQLCALAGGGASCPETEIGAAHAALVAGGIPAAAMQGTFLRARIQLDSGQGARAASTLDELLGQMHFLRRVLPGAMGAWYWQSRTEVFGNYLTLMGRTGHERGDGFHALLALSRARWIEDTAGSESRPWEAGIDTDALRVLMARREGPEDGDSPTALNDRINPLLQRARAAFAEAHAFLSPQGLAAYLDSLGADEAILTYHVTPSGAFALLGQAGRVQRRNLARPGTLSLELETAAGQWAVLEDAAFDRLADALGEQLTTPLPGSLPTRVYFIPAGALSGLPLDALREDGRFVVEARTVVNVLSFPAHPNPSRALRPDRFRRVFLAGDPSDYSGEYLSHLTISPEMRAVTDAFVGPGLSIVQGSALQPDEFEDARFLEADLAHLAMPVYMDLGEPARSSLELSEAGRDTGRTRLGLDRVRAWRLRAGLVFISSSRIGGQPISAYDGRLGLVTAFHEAGAGAVVASLWGGAEGGSVGMIRDFYGRLASGQDLAAALSGSKRSRAAAGSGDGLRDWARLQLYIR